MSAGKTIPHTIPLLMSIDETFDIGVDTRTPVDDSYNVPFRFYRDNQQVDLQSRAGAVDCGGSKGRRGSTRQSP